MPISGTFLGAMSNGLLVVRRGRQAWCGGAGEGGLELGLHGVADGVPVGEHKVGEEGLVDVEEAEVDGFEAGFDEEQEDAPAAVTACPSSSRKHLVGAVSIRMRRGSMRRNRIGSEWRVGRSRWVWGRRSVRRVHPGPGGCAQRARR